MLKKELPKLIVILGPTASGKTDLAIKLAKKFNGEIICADSRSIYKGLDIGTAKPMGKESKIMNYESRIVNEIPHYMIDIVNPDQEFTVAQFKQIAVNIIKSINKRHKIPFLVGGTGLYISSIVNNLDIPRVAPDKKLRKKLEKDAENRGIDYLWQKLIKLDPDAADFVQKQNLRRIIRALEVCLATGKQFSKLRKKGKPLFNTLQIGIKTNKKILQNKIDKRTNKMIKMGLIQEVKELIKKYPKNPPSFAAIGYQEIIPYLENQDHLDTECLSKIVEEIKKNTRRYARRQMTWFKQDKKIKWTQNYQEAEKLVKEFLS